MDLKYKDKRRFQREIKVRRNEVPIKTKIIKKDMVKSEGEFNQDYRLGHKTKK